MSVRVPLGSLVFSYISETCKCMNVVYNELATHPGLIPDSRLTPSVPGIASGSTVTLTEINSDEVYSNELMSIIYDVVFKMNLS